MALSVSRVVRRCFITFALVALACGVPDYSFDEKADSGKPDASGGTGGLGGSAGDASVDAPMDADAGGCSSDQDCAALTATPVCDLSTSTCVECLPENDVCPSGTYCSATTCVVGCNENEDCVPSGLGMPDGGLGDSGTDDAGDGGVTLTCDLTQHLCVGCVYDWDCPVGTICNGADSTCVPGCLDASTCPSGFDCCGNQCVNPQTSTDHCGACDTPCVVDQGTGKCESGACVVGSCDTGFGDCNASGADGCESVLGVDPVHCGSCTNPCPPLANAAAACDQGSCGLGNCNTGFQDCNGTPGDGCEVNLLTDGGNCGSCGYACSLLNSNEACQAGVCGIATCDAGYDNCDNVASTGCEINTQTDPDHCGNCTTQCQYANASAACTGGQCQIGSCASPYANCNASSADGCETNLNTDISDCGTCGKVCSSTNGTPNCSGGVCDIACSAGYADCNNDPANGCEINIGNNVNNCGSCGKVCSSNNGTASCSSGNCGIACSLGFANCDGNVTNGCEVNTNTNVDHCGSCNNVCPTPGGATPNCVNAVCGISSCTAPFADCNGSSGDGCEINTNTNAGNCGSCGNICSVANGSGSCNSGNCTVGSCNTGFANCDGLYTNGCEKNTNTDPQNCGSCGTVCTVANGTGACSNGSCAVGSCNPGWANCDGLVSNGCEKNLNTTTDCGACGVTCTNAHGSTTCSSGVCNPSCSTNWGNCNGIPNDGCETSLTTLSDCGSCGTGCNLQNASESCGSGSCQVTTCNAGFGNCDGTHPNGCEINTQTSVPHCGGCNMACSPNNGSPSCGGGNCSISCNSGYGNCNLDARLDGCEINTTNNTSHCGTCGNACSGGQVCQSSTCVTPGCNPGFVTCGVNNCTCQGTACCGPDCQVVHDTGLGQNWFDCVAYGTYNSAQAAKACQAWTTATGTAGSCEQLNCQQGLAMCNQTGKACWGFSSQIAGKVYKAPSGPFFCPLSTDPNWDP